MKHLIIACALLVTYQAVFAQKKIEGTVRDYDDKPVKGATIIVKSMKNTQTHKQTDKNGMFSVKGVTGDTVEIIYNELSIETIIVTDSIVNNGIGVKLIHRLTDSEKNGGPQSPNSFWIGAKIGYNFDGFSDKDLDNYFVGAAKVVLNKSESDFLKGQWGVVGNIANFISNQNKDEAEKDKEKIALSVQGLGVGLYQLWENKIGKGGNYFRKYITTGYRLNTFKNVGADSATVNLSQFKLTGGLEFEAFQFAKGGALNLSCEVSHLRFSENRYQTIFGEKKNSLTSIELGIILPLNENLGFFSSGTFAKDMKPVYLFGIIVKSDSPKEKKTED